MCTTTTKNPCVPYCNCLLVCISCLICRIAPSYNAKGKKKKKIACGAQVANPHSYCTFTGQQNIKAGESKRANKNHIETDGASANFGCNMEGPVEIAYPWLVALDNFPQWLFQTSKVTFKNSCFAQIVADLMSV